MDGHLVGSNEGTPEGMPDGRREGRPVGCAVGELVGIELGRPVGDNVGKRLGTAVGTRVGGEDGTSVGAADGLMQGVPMAVPGQHVSSSNISLARTLSGILPHTPALPSTVSVVPESLPNSVGISNVSALDAKFSSKPVIMGLL